MANEISRDDLHPWFATEKQLSNYALELRDERDKLRLDLQAAKHEAQVAKEAVRLLEADVAVLRESIATALSLDDGSNDAPFALLQKLLASPNPGAGYVRVIGAALELNSKRPLFGTPLYSGALDRLAAAVRALDAPQPEQPEESAGKP